MPIEEVKSLQKVKLSFSCVYNLFFNCHMELADNHSPV